MMAHGLLEPTSYFGIYYYFFFFPFHSFFFFLFLPHLTFGADLVVSFFFSPERKSSGCPGQRDIKHGVKATFFSSERGIMQTRGEIVSQVGKRKSDGTWNGYKKSSILCLFFASSNDDDDDCVPASRLDIFLS